MAKPTPFARSLRRWTKAAAKLPPDSPALKRERSLWDKANRARAAEIESARTAAEFDPIADQRDEMQMLSFLYIYGRNSTQINDD